MGTGEFAVGDSLTRADCTLVPALWMCSSTIPRLGFDSPIVEGTGVSAYWNKIQNNGFAVRILDEMNKGMKARLDGTERKMAEEAIARAKANSSQ
jgi:glutathione S-transferase